MSNLTPQELLRVDFKQGERPTTRPLNPPGADYDTRAFEDGSALYPAAQQQTTITLGGSTVTSDVTTLVVTPLTTTHGSPAADSLVPYTFVFTTGATQTLAAVAAGLDANAASQQTVTSVADLANFARVADFMAVTSSGDDVVITTRDAGATFSWELISTGSVTQGGAVTTGDGKDPIPVGIIVTQKAVAIDGQRKMGAPASATEAVLGLLMWSANVAERTAGDAGSMLERSKDGQYRKYGSGMAISEKTVTVDSQVYYRVTVPGTETAGAVTDTPVAVQQVTVGTPTVVNDTLYRLQLEVVDLWTGAVKASGIASYTSDASATAAEIVDNSITNIASQAPSVDALISTANVADTLEITVTAGCVINVLDLDANFPFVQSVAASSEHAPLAGATFLETTNARTATRAPIALPHP